MPVSRGRSEATGLGPVPYWCSDCKRAAVYVGDCRNVLAVLNPDQFHAVVTDPPYGLGFDVGQVKGDWDAPWKHTRAKDRRADEMGDPVKAKYLRDGQAFEAWFEKCAAAALRVAKPGAHLLSFGGTRMWHRMVCGAEDAGWEVRDTLMWVYSSGYPKGKDVSKDIDRVLGAEREVVGRERMADTTKVRPGFTGAAHGGESSGSTRYVDLTVPATEEARAWDGWNTTLKPAWEPVLLARKTPVGGVARNVLEHGCGGVNVGECRVGEGGELWPANLLHDGADPQLCRYFYAAKAGADPDNRPHGGTATAHPTVKPLDLMRYLVRLVCARGGVVLDPFMGSGSTGCAALEEGMRFVGVEQSVEYADVAVGRLKLSLGRVGAVGSPPPAPGKFR